MQRPRRDGIEGAPRARTQSHSHTVDVIVLTDDSGLLATLQEAAGVGHWFFHASSIENSVELLLGGHCGIFLIDVALVGNELARLTEKLQAQFPEVVLLATGRRNEQNAIAGLVASGRIYRFLHKPVSPARAELFLSAATRRYGELHPHESRTAGAARRLATSRSRNVLIGLAVAVAALGAAWMFWPRDSVERVVQPEAVATPPIAAPADTAQLQEALANASDAYESGNVLPPAEGNALDLYRSALQLDPGNADARAGVERIVADAERQVTAAIAAQDAPRATIAWSRLQNIAPAHPRLDALQAELIALARKSRPAQVAAPVRSPAPIATPAAAPQRRTSATPKLDLAKAYLAANQLVEPADASALRQLRQARAAGEDEGAVQITATDLGRRLLNRALAAIDAADVAIAKSAFDAAVSLDREFATSLPDLDVVGSRVRELESAAQRATSANERLARVAKLRSSGRLIEPTGDNAYEALKQILAEAAASPEIRTEQQRLSFALLENTRTALAAGDVDRADVLATRAEEIQPGLPQTKVLREQIGAARAERDDRNAVLQAAGLVRRREVPAVYPRDALLNAIEGWVDLEFVISAAGVPTDVTVKAAQPPRVFDTAATQALRQWRFEPIVRNGVQQSRRATLRIEFKLKQ